jgi:uncharacterized repeat protein (TIGR04076 family)
MADIGIEEARAIGQRFKEHVGLSDAEFEEHISYAFNRRLLASHDEMIRYKIIAEVTEAEHCGAGCEVGKRFVFSAVPCLLLPEESDCGLCIKALGPISRLMDGLWDRMTEGLDPNQGIGLYASCLDMGIKYGGLGNVKFRVYAQKED